MDKSFELYDTSVYNHSIEEMVDFTQYHFSDLYNHAVNNMGDFHHDKIIEQDDIGVKIIQILESNIGDDIYEIHSYTGVMNYLMSNKDMISFWLL